MGAERVREKGNLCDRDGCRAVERLATDKMTGWRLQRENSEEKKRREKTGERGKDRERTEKRNWGREREKVESEWKNRQVKGWKNWMRKIARNLENAAKKERKRGQKGSSLCVKVLLDSRATWRSILASPLWKVSSNTNYNLGRFINLSLFEHCTHRNRSHP